MGVLEILRAGGYSKIKLVALEAVPPGRGETLKKRPDRDARARHGTKDFAAAMDHGRHSPRSRFTSAERRWRCRIWRATKRTTPWAPPRSRSGWN